MEKFSFFNDVNGDRVYYAEDWARHLKKYFTNGIFNNELNVVSNNDMTITIKEGDANIEGYRYTNTGDLVKTIDNADGTLNRIDNVVLRLDLTNRLISAQIIKGTFADKPVAPELVRTSTIYDLRIAKISIPAGTTTITQDLITDTRFITSDCGNVISTVQTPDTENLFIQMQTLFEKQINELNNNFEIWFDSIKNQLDSDAAGNLQNQINNLNSNKVDNAKYDPNSKNLQLTSNGKIVGDSVHIPTGITDEVSGEEDLKIINNKGVVKFSVEGKTEQDSYTGKNILDYITKLNSSGNGLTNVINDDGSITTSGKPSVNYSQVTQKKEIIDELEDGQTYTISQAVANRFLYLEVAIKSKDGTYTYLSCNLPERKSVTFTVDKNVYVSYIIAIQTTTTATFGNSSLTITNKYMLCKGTDTADSSFEPYVGGTQSPNSNYPQKIKNVRGIENLFKPTLATTVLNGITCAANRDGTYTLNGIATADTTFTIGTDKNLIIDKTYKFLGCPNGGSNTTYRMSWNFHDYEYGNGLISKKTSEARNVQITIFKGITASNLVFKPMFTEDTLLTYNNFVPNGSNYLQLENVGENILNIDETPFTVKKITSQGNVLYWSGYSGVNDFVKVKEKTTYKFSSNEVNKVCYIDYYDKNKNYLSRTGTAVDYFTTPENCKYIKFAINLELIPTNAQLREGTIIKPYEPYQKKIINIDLKGNNLCSDKEQTLKDELVIENGKAKIIKKYDEVVLDGTETPVLSTTFDTVARFYFDKVISSIKNSQCSSNYFKWYQSQSTNIQFNNTTNDIEAIHIRDDGTGIGIKINKSIASTVDELKTWLSNNPVKVQYQLAEPKVIDLGEVDFDLIEGNSTLNLEEDLKSNMSIKYYTDSTVVDLKKKVENKQNVILHGTTIPSNDLGEDGDIYLQHN